MAEQTINKQLGASEIIEAVLDTLRQKMRRDCYFNPGSAYDWFDGEITVKLRMHDTGSNLTAEHTVKVGDPSGKVPDGSDTVDDVITINKIESPNDVREMTGQPIPTMTRDAEGHKVEKGVKYARKGKYGVAAATTVLLAFLCAGTAYAQANHVEQLSNTERIAIQAVGKEQADALAKARAVAADIAANHPGYHYDNTTGNLVKDEAKGKAKAEDKTEVGKQVTSGDESKPAEPKQ